MIVLSGLEPPIRETLPINVYLALSLQEEDMETNPTPYNNKGRYQLRYRGVECTNCGHPLDISDRFCPNCAQANSSKKPTLKDFFDEFFASMVSYDSKLLRTLSALLLKPGKITRDYLNGKRVSYTNPFRFLLSLGIIYFLMVSFNLGTGLSKLDRFGSDEKGSFFNENGGLVFSTDLGGLDSITNTNLGEQLDSLDLAKAIAKKDSAILSNPKKYLKDLDSLSFASRFGSKRGFFSTLMKSNVGADYGEIIQKYDLPDTRMNRYTFNASTSYLRFTQRPGTFLESLISKLPFLIFFFLPVFTLFIWVAYIRKKYNYTDHLIFSFHIQSLLFILLIVSLLIDSIFNVFSGWIFILIFMVYLYKAMRGFYRQGRFKTIIKYAFFNFIFVILAILSVTVLATASVYTY